MKGSRRRLTLVAMALGAICAIAVVAAAGRSAQAQEALPALTVYKSPACGCCVKWIDYMRAEGFAVKAVDVDSIADVKRTWSVPTDVAACHTAIAGSYVIEGHVPADVVRQFLRERPQVAGIAVAGMPLGSPGMESPSGYAEPYAVMSFDRAGRTAVYARR